MELSLAPGAGGADLFALLALARARLSRVVALANGPRRLSLRPRRDGWLLPSADGIPELGRRMVARQPVPASGRVPRRPRGCAGDRVARVARPLRPRARVLGGGPLPAGLRLAAPAGKSVLAAGHGFSLVSREGLDRAESSFFPRKGLARAARAGDRRGGRSRRPGRAPPLSPRPRRGAGRLSSFRRGGPPRARAELRGAALARRRVRDLLRARSGARGAEARGPIRLDAAGEGCRGGGVAPVREMTSRLQSTISNTFQSATGRSPRRIAEREWYTSRKWASGSILESAPSAPAPSKSERRGCRGAQDPRGGGRARPRPRREGGGGGESPRWFIRGGRGGGGTPRAPR